MKHAPKEMHASIGKTTTGSSWSGRASRGLIGPKKKPENSADRTGCCVIGKKAKEDGGRPGFGRQKGAPIFATITVDRKEELDRPIARTQKIVTEGAQVGSGSRRQRKRGKRQPVRRGEE